METYHDEEEESNKSYATKYSLHNRSVCTCSIPCKCTVVAPIPTESAQKVELVARAEHILGAVSRTENYLRERRIPELIRFLLRKLLASGSDNPVAYLLEILDDCMLYRAGYGQIPVLYEERHLEAVVKSFDPGQRRWVSANQLRRAYITIGLNPPTVSDDEKIPTSDLLKNLKNDQEKELYELLTAGTLPEKFDILSSTDDGDETLKYNTPVKLFL